MADNAFDPPTVRPEDQVFSKKVGGRYVLNPPPPAPPSPGDPNFAPFDPVAGDPALSAAERVKRGFEATRVEDRSRFPDPMGGFLVGPSPFDPPTRFDLPESGGYIPSQNRQSTSQDLFNPMAQKLGIIDLEHQQTDQIRQLIRDIAEAKKRKEASGVK